MFKTLADKIAAEIEREASARFMSAVFKYLDGERTGLHVTDTTQECQRHGYWSWKARDAGVKETLNEKSALTFMLGKKVHELPVTPNHEQRFDDEYRGLNGTPDELWVRDDKVLVIQDKKTKLFLPKAVDDQYATQVRRYAALLYLKLREESDDLPNAWYGVITYVSIGEEKGVRSFAFKIDIDAEVRDLNDILDAYQEADKTGVPPPSTYYWLCGYCPFYTPCRRLDAGDKDWAESLSFKPPNKLPPVQDLGVGIPKALEAQKK